MQTAPVDVVVKFEVCSFECILCGTLQPCVHRQTKVKTQYPTVSLHSPFNKLPALYLDVALKVSELLIYSRVLISLK